MRLAFLRLAFVACCMLIVFALWTLAEWQGNIAFGFVFIGGIALSILLGPWEHTPAAPAEPRESSRRQRLRLTRRDAA